MARPTDTEILLAELAGTVPLSVTMSERIAALRDWASNRAVAADKKRVGTTT